MNLQESESKKVVTEQPLSDVNNQTSDNDEKNVADEKASEEQQTVVDVAPNVELLEEELKQASQKMEEQLSDKKTEALAQELDGESSNEEEVEEEAVDEPLPDTDYNDKSREELVEALDELIKNHSVNIIKSHVSSVKVAFLAKSKEERKTKLDSFISAGGVEENFEDEKDEIQERFDALFDLYREKKSIYIASLETKKEDNLKEKQDILETLKTLISSSESLKSTYDQFRELQEKWHAIGMVPKGDVNTLWNNYHFLVEKFFDKVRISQELKDLDLKKNLESKIQLCEKVEELLIVDSISESFKKLQQFHKEWKETGPVPFDKKDEVWERFKTTTDKINKRRREHYEELRVQLEKNYETKLALCEKATELIAEIPESIKVWNEKTKDINELLKIWKSVGPASRKVNDEVWAAFKKSLDTFYSAKKEYYGRIKEQQTHNYNLKLDLCVQAEAIMNSEDWKQTSRELIRLQKEWKNIGPAPRKVSDKVWKRFRAACDTFFNKKEAFFANINEHEAENLKKREELITEINEATFTEDKKENLKILKEFQRRWMGLGHVPIKEKDRVHKQYRQAIDVQMEKLNISATEVSAMQYKNRIDAVKSQPDAKRILYRESSALNNKISKIKEEINLWENNMGFLAASKNADLLKSEFEKKIKRAKNEITVLEAKLKLLQQQ